MTNWRDGTSANRSLSALEALLQPITLTGTRAARPAASTTNSQSLYFATDTNTLHYSNGTTWKTVSVPETIPSMLLPASIGTISGAIGTQAATANSLRAARFYAPHDGVVNTAYVALVSTTGFGMGGIYDDTITTRQRLWTGVTTALATNGWQNLGSPNLTVSAGQAFDLGAILDNTTVGHFRAALGAVQATLPSPLGRGTPDGGASAYMGWAISPGGFSVPSTLTEASFSVTGTVILTACQFTPA